MEHVEGKIKKCKVKVFALSTCIWCKKTKKLLKELSVDYDFVDVDQLPQDEREKAENEMDGWGATSFPLIVVNDKECIRGYEPDEIKKKLLK